MGTCRTWCYEFSKAQFSEAEMASLTYGIVAINGWNRLCMSFRVPPNVHASSWATVPVQPMLRELS